jgi:hypothetical protein
MDNGFRWCGFEGFVHGVQDHTIVDGKHSQTLWYQFDVGQTINREFTR